MKFMLIAGEPSGDLHASRLIESLKEQAPGSRFVFLGGDLMAEAAGCPPAVHYREMAFMGFSEVLRNLGKVRRNLATARRLLSDERPDALVLVDYPSFNLKVAATAHALGIPVYYYISPKIWAWKSWRLKTIARLVRRVLCILPFEPAWYSARGFSRAEYVGNPSVEEIDRALLRAPAREQLYNELRLRRRPLLLLMPGSRRGEIRCNLPVMSEAARRFPGYNIVVAGAPGIDDSWYATFTTFRVVRGRTFDLLRHAHAALVTSGTATLEAALASVPQVVLYRSNGSRLAYKLMEKILKVKYVSLPNLILDAPAVPELLLHHCTPDSVADTLARLTPERSEARHAQLESYARMRAILTT
ncbi:MAG: lipid-A-disaccharide synthase, partial [Muribaculaceae bacterium]|nr:lipid-A-disaccharide synthase [Muribaculaceae bacterium]